MTTTDTTTTTERDTGAVPALVRPVLTYKCPRCVADSGTADYSKFTDWYIAHRALTCRCRRPNTIGQPRLARKENHE